MHDSRALQVLKSEFFWMLEHIQECLASPFIKISVLIKSEDHDFGLGKQRSHSCIVASFHFACGWHGGSLGLGAPLAGASRIVETNSEACS